MTIRINNLSLSLDDDISLLKKKVSKKLRISEKEIEDLIIKNCLRYGQDDLCAQISNDSYMEICEKCIGWQWRGDTRSNMKDYLYLIIRSKLYNGIELNCIEEYHKLEGYENERKSLRLISEYLKKQAIKLYDF